jgi:hypothetical protein
MVSFQPKYTVINKTALTLYIIQSRCEETGLFKIFPFESSVFHWTDSANAQEVSIKLEGYEYSGNFKIDSIGETQIRLRSTYNRESMIVSVVINDDNNCYQILISDISHAPPYRIENLTRNSFKLSQKYSRSEDFDIIRPFESLIFAWTYPLAAKYLNVTVIAQSYESDLGFHEIDK